MNVQIYLRPLKMDDASVSYQWRNDEAIWKYTNFVAYKPVTLATEQRWLANVLARPDQKRFAICLSSSHQYIGNVQLLRINKKSAELHLFIGEKDYWGFGIGFSATSKLLEMAFAIFKLKVVFLDVHPENLSAIRCYQKAGFETIEPIDNMVRMQATPLSASRLG